jgi:thioredoxin-like negative regulator of GroEL
MCSDDVIDMLPGVQAKVPAGLNPYTGKPLIHTRDFRGGEGGAVSPKIVSKFILDNMPYLGETLKPSNLQEYLDDKDMNKIILFTNKTKPPPLYRALASEFRGYIHFGLVYEKEEELVNRYEVTSFPTFLAIRGGEITQFEGKPGFDTLSEFFEPFKSAKKFPPKLKKNTKKTNTDEQQQRLPEYHEIALTAANFDSELEKEPKLTLVHFFKDKKDPSWDEIHNTYKGIVLTARMDCKEEENEEFAHDLGVKKFPAIRVFPANR